jgi:alkanesulfonate monooxygenase SsuD/methylene tetrahydromethanopterin reductase-like flavin-dependent oxidoreductase (luciferase family)
MPLFGLRYDFRCPPLGRTSHAELFAAALDQCAWADRLGFSMVTLSEHHGSPDFAALIAPLHDPIRLAEDIAVLDVISGGRVIPVLSGGYVASEFEGFGRKLSDRRHVMEEIVPLLKQAWSGEPFQWRGRTVRVTPRPLQQPRPPIFMGGGSKAAARRAARHADQFIPTVPELFEVYREERRKLGRPDAGPLPATTGNFVWVAEDPEAAWEVIAPHALQETNPYGHWQEEAGTTGPYRLSEDPQELRRSGGYTVLTPQELVERARAMGPLDMIILHPLMGGLDPEFSWQCLRLVETQVLPALQG